MRVALVLLLVMLAPAPAAAAAAAAAHDAAAAVTQLLRARLNAEADLQFLCITVHLITARSRF